MPPKIYRKPVRDDLKPKNQDPSEKAQLAEKWDVNIKHVVENNHVMERVHTLTSILAGVLAGIFNANLYIGILAYVCLHLFITLMIVGNIGNVSKYFLKKSDIISGLGSGVPVFMCAWIIIFNIVYTL